MTKQYEKKFCKIMTLLKLMLMILQVLQITPGTDSLSLRTVQQKDYTWLVRTDLTLGTHNKKTEPRTVHTLH